MKHFVVKAALAAAVSLAAFAAPAAAQQNFSYTGTLASANDVQLFNFVVGAPSTVTLRTYSYAGGTNAEGTVIARGGFDPILALFNSSGALINQNDDGGGFVAPDAVTGQRYDTYLSSVLGAGSYTVSVMAYSNFAAGPNLSNGFLGGGSFTDATGNPRTNAWAFDILNVESAVVSGVPEASTWAMMLVGFGAVGVAVRRRRKPAVAQFA